MKKLVLAFLLLAGAASAQVVEVIKPPDEAGFDGGSITSPLILPDGTKAAPSLQCASNLDTGAWCTSAGALYFTLDNQDHGSIGWEPDWLGYGPTFFITDHFTMVGNGFATGTWFATEGNGIVGQGLSTQANAYRIYKTKGTLDTGSPTNFERVSMGWTTTADTFEIVSQAGGTGTERPILLSTDNGGQTVQLDNNSIDIGSNAQISLTTGTSALSNATFTTDTASLTATNGAGSTYSFEVSDGNSWIQSLVDTATDDASVTVRSNQIIIDADQDNDADGTITISTDNSGQTILLDSDSIDLDSNALIEMTVGNGDGNDGLVYVSDSSVWLTSVDFVNGVGVYDTGTSAYVQLHSEDAPTLLSAITGGLQDGDGSVTLTQTTTTTVISLVSTSGYATGGEFHYAVFAEDATDHSVRTGTVPFSLSNKGGTLICDVGTPSESIVASGGATLTCTASCNVSTATAQFQLNCNSSLTTTLFQAYPSLQLFGNKGGYNVAISTP